MPALATASGVLTETPAILAFIAQMAPEKKLAPLDDPFEFALMQSFNAFISSTVHVAHAHGRRGSRWANEDSSLADMKAKVPQTMGECFELIEHGMLHGPWVLGTAYSVADPYLFVMSGWLESDGVDIARFPRVHDHFRRMNDRPAVQRALAGRGAEGPSSVLWLLPHFCDKHRNEGRETRWRSVLPLRPPRPRGYPTSS